MKHTQEYDAFQTTKGKVCFYLAIVVLLVFALLPFVFTLSASFQREYAIKAGQTTLIPTEVTIGNYQQLLTNKEGGLQAFPLYIANSIKVAVGTCLLSLVVSVFAAYALARFRFPGREAIARIMLFLYVFPTILAIYPVYTILAQFNLINTHLGLILVHTTLVAPFCAWFLRTFFSTIPLEIEEAATVDGASRLRIIRSIILPLSAPGMLAAGMYALIYSWGGIYVRLYSD